MKNKNGQKKLKIWWFSKAGKITLWVIFWIIVAFFCGVWIFHSYILYNQLNEYWEDFQWWYPSDLDIYLTLLKDHWIAVSEESFDQLSNKWYWWLISRFVVPKDNKWKEWGELWLWSMSKETPIINIDDSFESREWTWGRFYLNIPYHTKLTQSRWDPVYWEELDERHQKIEVWKTIHELKLEVSNARSVDSFLELVNNSEHKHIWQNSQRIAMHSFTSNLSKPLEEWETKCIILTPFDRITKELMDAHDENCEFWLLSEKPWFDESLLEIKARKNKASDELPNIKISHITVDLPIYK
jgi:hypothetical protein